MRTRLLLLVGLLGSPQLAAAAPTQHDLRFVGGSGVGFHGVQVGTYRGQLDGGGIINIWCTDFYNYAGNARVYQSSIGAGDLSKTRWGTLPDQPNLYKRAAFLTTQFRADNHSEWGSIHYAIWQLMNGGNPGGLSVAEQAKVDGYKALSLAKYLGYDYSKMYVLTDKVVTGGTGRRGDPYRYGCQGVQGHTTCGIQEQLAGEISAVPEPASMGLMGLGLVGLAAVRRRRKIKTQ